MFRTMIALAGIIFSCSVLAASADKATSDDSHFFLGVSAGPAWATGNRTQTIYLESDVVKTYTADNNWSVFPSAEIFIGWQKPLSSTLFGLPLTSQTGIALVGTGNAELSGDVWEDASPDYNNYTYHYKVQHTHAAIKGRLFAGNSSSLQPYISASIGMGFNHAYDFTVSPTVDGEIAAPAFQSNTQNAVVYTLGIGVQKTFNPHVQMSLGYEFADWGKIQLSRAAGQTMNQGLSLNHLYAQQIQLALFYIF